MKLVNGFSLMEYAKKKHYVLPAFNTTNLEMTYAIARGLMEAALPGYIQISSNNLRLSNPPTVAAMAVDAVKDLETPIGLHLDHGKSFEDVRACVDAGFTSVMIDASHLPFEENVKECRRAADYCHFYHIPVEAELGALRGKEDEGTEEIKETKEAILKTDPKMAAEFAARTGCDTLAVSVGNVHGLCLNPEIDLDLLERIHHACPVPLVLHGGSGIPVKVIREAKKHGLIKINFGSDLRKEFIRTFGEAYEENHNEYDVIHLSIKAVENVSRKVKELTVMINKN